MHEIKFFPLQVLSRENPQSLSVLDLKVFDSVVYCIRYRHATAVSSTNRLRNSNPTFSPFEPPLTNPFILDDSTSLRLTLLPTVRVDCTKLSESLNSSLRGVNPFDRKFCLSLLEAVSNDTTRKSFSFRVNSKIIEFRHILLRTIRK